ncbi:hypothetical protein RRG08_055554 [Elysia crispata]|uniref:Uncharacterized protein n=1 Tax=Elysia crispata TaxID=231223 RepID=A0AAE1ADA0_9GAST|nr:hypothetical protein RRG08_055554 [Elysia crispata]
MSELSNLTTCIATNLDSCTKTSIKNEIRAVKDIIVYMCSEEGQQVVLDLADSSCANDPLIETRMEIMMMGCLEDFQFGIQMAQLEAYFEGREFNISEVCPFIDELHVCIVNNGAEMCGPAMGSFLSSIWGIASRDQFTQFGCHQEAAVTRRALKRAVPMLLKRAALIRKYRK